MYRRPLEHFFDRQGETKLGWLDTNIFYGELRDSISAQLAEQYAQRLGTFLDGTSSIQIFLDSSMLRSCDLLGKSAILRVLMAHRLRITRITILSSPEIRRAHGVSMWSILGEVVEYTPGRTAFAERLLALAPRAGHEVPGLSATGQTTEPHGDAPAPASSVRRLGTARAGDDTNASSRVGRAGALDPRQTNGGKVAS